MNIFNIDFLEYCKSLKSNSVNLIIADPPAFKIIKDKWCHQWKTEDEYVQWLVQGIKEFERVLTNDGSLYLFQWIGKENPLTMAKVLIEIDKQTSLKFKNFLTWRKDRGFGVCNNWMYVREEILFYTKSDKNYTFNVQYSNIKRNYIRKCGKSFYKRCGNVWIDINYDDFPATNIFDDINEHSYESIKEQRIEEYSLDTKADVIHSTQKPIQLSERLIKTSSNEGDLVYIPFAGSGVDIMACIKNNRKYIATELDKTYFDQIENNINQYIDNHTYF